jgi:formaldehyde-activating enzyme involved in methanogenesis
MAIMSLRQYAKHRGVALSAVQKAIQSGRIRTLADGKVDSDAADAEWQKNTKAHVPAVTRRTDPEEDDGAIFGASQYTKARAVREHYQARLAKIEYEERTGKLVSKDEVQVAAFNKFRQFRDHMLNIPDRLAAILAAETESAKCYEILATEIRKALNEFADSNN